MHLREYLMLSLIQNFLIVNLVKMFKVDLAFVLEGIVNETMSSWIFFCDWWRNVWNF